MERDIIKETLKNWEEATPAAVSSAVKDTLAHLHGTYEAWAVPKTFKRKRLRIPVATAVCACLLLTILVATPLGSAALAAIQKVFGMFTEQYNNDEQNQIFINLEQQAEQPGQQIVNRTGGEENVSAFIDGIYFDGTQLVLSYIVQGKADFDTNFHPTQEELAQMRVLAPDESIIFDPTKGLEEQWAMVEREKLAGQPVGWRSYDVSIDDHAYTEDGVDLPPDADDYIWRGPEKVGVRFYLLPDIVTARETLTIDVTFRVNETRYYFDGGKEYFSTKKGETQTVRVTAAKQDAIMLTGNGSFPAYQAQASVTLSPVFTSLYAELTPMGNNEVKQVWLHHYKSENDLQGVPLQYSLYDESGTLLAKDIANTWHTCEDKMIIKGRMPSIEPLPERLILKPSYVDGVSHEDESILLARK